jgi:Raf kinase inhibitor-like YbhB/YbcL family protein
MDLTKNSGALVWALTGILAIGIIGAAVMVSKKRAQTLTSTPVRASGVPIDAGDSGQARSVLDVQKETDANGAAEIQSYELSEEQAAEPEPENYTLEYLANYNFPHLISVESPRIQEGLRMPLDFTCYRTNKSPPLTWRGAPENARSLVVMLTRNTEEKNPFVKWVLFNIDPAQSRLRENLPKNEVFEGGMAHAKSDYKTIGYVGPCEPKGRISYSFRIFALDTVLDAAPGISRDELIQMMGPHVIDYDEFNFEHYRRF